MGKKDNLFTFLFESQIGIGLIRVQRPPDHSRGQVEAVMSTLPSRGV